MSTLERILTEAAEARSAGVRAPADRPNQRRSAEVAGSLAVVRSAGVVGSLRAAQDDSGSLIYDGFASVYNRSYAMWDMFGPYTEQVSSGAGAVSLAKAGLDVPFVLDHDSMRRIARTTNGTLALSEEIVGDDEGLRVLAPSLDPTDADVAYIAPKLRNGLIDEMSFRFRIESGSWSPDWTEYHIDAYDIDRGDVSIVGYGANPFTKGAGLREGELPDLRNLTEARLLRLANDVTAERKRREPAAPAMTYAQLLLLQD